MERLQKKVHNLAQRKHRVRAKVGGTTARPRLSVFISNVHITAQIIDDEKQKTLVYVTTVGDKTAQGNMSERAARIGGQIAKKAQAAKIKRVVFDRNGRLYHGRIKALADAARAEGLEF
ncbi:MAG TPA: 50S ribosomal protein L18 [Candidatus Saccharimonadales bacterium]|nr:50S ribosomal protein L18 [Candidatus Saccharimonadales bacterium]